MQQAMSEGVQKWSTSGRDVSEEKVTLRKTKRCKFQISIFSVMTTSSNIYHHRKADPPGEPQAKKGSGSSLMKSRSHSYSNMQPRKYPPGLTSHF